MKLYLAAASLILLASCNSNDDKDVRDPGADPKYMSMPAPANIGYSIVAEYPHDTSAYTQGLQVHNGKFYEGTGDFETSSLRIVDIKTGKVEKKHMMGTDKIFGEGINIFNGKLYQLTWESHLVYVYDVNNIDKPIKTFNWPYDGWGITNDDTSLIISDGTANLYFVDPETFKVKEIKSVNSNAGPQLYLNELEYIDGFIYANVYQSEYIVKIDPATGNIVGRIDLPGLKEKYFQSQIIPQRTDVLNGIAYDSSTKKIYITGKRWPKLFEIELK
jgi:glutaminyl-peptide cyclotransferase